MNCNSPLPRNIRINHKQHLLWFSFFIVIIVSILTFGSVYYVKRLKNKQPIANGDYYLNILSEGEKQTLQSCFRISFIGDLILLRPQVQRGANADGSFDFSPMFEYTRKYFKTDDCTIAVWEGPCAGNSLNYSNSAYGDKSFLQLNFPDEFASAARIAGVDFVSVATNHVLDCGKNAIGRTLQILEKEQIGHVGVTPPNSVGIKTPRHKTVTLSDESGNQIRIAILAYTYGSNYIPSDAFFTGEHRGIVSCLVAPESPHYKAAVEQVINEIREAKKDNPDCLLIMPHMGGQFNHAPDAFQQHWCRIFTDAGADVILSDHPHATQPCEWFTRSDGKTCLIIHCPGNYANSYTDMDGDAVAITEVYLDKRSGNPKACGIIPMWVRAQGKGQFIPVPLPEYLYNQDKLMLSNTDWKRLEEVSRIITSSMLGQEIHLHSAAIRYYTFESSGNKMIFRDPWEQKLTDEEVKYSPLVKYLQSADSVCFVGDSITEGTKNYGYGWYEPIAAHLKNVHCCRFAKGSKTSLYFLQNADKLAATKSNIYVMAYGTNDIRYRNPQICAMTADEYIFNTTQLIDRIRSTNPKASFIFIAPWTSDIDDKNCRLSNEEKYEMMREYALSLKNYCIKAGHWFIDPNPLIEKQISNLHTGFKWLVDDIHPNGTTGVQLYSRAVLQASQQNIPTCLLPSQD